MTERIQNPLTGRWVRQDTTTGKRVLKMIQTGTVYPVYINRYNKYRPKEGQIDIITTSSWIGNFPTILISQLEQIAKTCFSGYSYENVARAYPNSHYFYTFDNYFNLYAILLLDSTNTIWDVCTNPEYRRKGYQTRLFQYLFQTLNTLGIQEVYLYVEPKNKNAIDMYEKLGFEITQSDRRTPIGQIRMRKQI